MKCRWLRNDVAMTATNSYLLHPKAHPRAQGLIPKGANSLQLKLANGPTRDLSHVKIGRLFVFGLAEDDFSWCVIRLSSVTGIRFAIQELKPSTEISWTRLSAGECLTTLQLPAPGIIHLRDPSAKKLQVIILGSSRGLVATDSWRHEFVPMAAINSLEITGG